jgi:hypothetical protein
LLSSLNPSAFLEPLGTIPLTNDISENRLFSEMSDSQIHSVPRNAQYLSEMCECSKKWPSQGS